MRILNLDGHYFVEPFRRMGHDVLWLGSLPGSDIVLEETISLSRLVAILDDKGFKPDLILWADLCKPPSVIGIESLPAVTIGYSIDQYCNPWHVPYSAAFDLMLVAQRDYIHLFEEANLGNTTQWAPLFCNPFKDKDLGFERDIDVAFVGTIDSRLNAERRAFLEEFKTRHPLFMTQGNYVPVFNRARLVLNQSAVGELNFRIFEAMACGAAVLTERIDNGLLELFTPGEDILTYPKDHAREAARQARSALADPNLAAIAQNGKRTVRSHHSATARARHIVNEAERIMGEGVQWRLREINVARKSVATAYNILAVDQELPLPSELRSLFARLGNQLLGEIR